jgi:hypothetical protein
MHASASGCSQQSSVALGCGVFDFDVWACSPQHNHCTQRFAVLTPSVWHCTQLLQGVVLFWWLSGFRCAPH